jgi:hypothetical protein
VKAITFNGKRMWDKLRNQRSVRLNATKEVTSFISATNIDKDDKAPTENMPNKSAKNVHMYYSID